MHSAAIFTAILSLTIIVVSAQNGTTPTAGKLTLPTITKTEITDSMRRAKACTPNKNVCITVTDMGDAFDVLAEGPPDAKWLGVGAGSTMADTDIVLGYMHNGSFVVSDRKATGRSAVPFDTQQDAIPIRGGLNVIQGKWVSQFQRLKQTGDVNDIGFDFAEPFSMIWAIHNTQAVTFPTSGDNIEYKGAITVHTSKGVIELNLDDAAQQAAARESGTSGSNQVPASSAVSSHILSISQLGAAMATLVWLI